MNGWIKLHRRIWSNPRSRDPDWIAVWLYLLCHANHGGTRAMWKGKIVDLKAGQLITGRKAISAATGVSESKVYRLLGIYKSEQQIEQQTSNASSLISITNWTAHQESEQRIEQPVNNHRTTDEQPVNTPEECKKVKKEENGRSTPLTPQGGGELVLESGEPEKPKKADHPGLVALAAAYRPRSKRVTEKDRKAWRDAQPEAEEMEMVVKYVTAWKQRKIREDSDLCKYCSTSLHTCLTGFSKQLRRAETYLTDPERYAPPVSLRKSHDGGDAF